MAEAGSMPMLTELLTSGQTTDPTALDVALKVDSPWMVPDQGFP